MVNDSSEVTVNTAPQKGPLLMFPIAGVPSCLSVDQLPLFFFFFLMLSEGGGWGALWKAVGGVGISSEGTEQAHTRGQQRAAGSFLLRA